MWYNTNPSNVLPENTEIIVLMYGEETYCCITKKDEEGKGYLHFPKDCFDNDYWRDDFLWTKFPEIRNKGVV